MGDPLYRVFSENAAVSLCKAWTGRAFALVRRIARALEEER
jgi:hypothetical protein